MKFIILSMLIALVLKAESYETLLKQALKNNIQLQISSKKQEMIALEGKIETRYKNPNLTIEFSAFDGLNNEFGSVFGMTQMLPLSPVQEDRKRLTKSKLSLEKQKNILEKSMFIYRFSLLYLDYKEAKRQEFLQSDASAISERIFGIAQMRFKGGKISRSKLLEAKIEHSMALGKQKELVLESELKKDEFLKFGNIMGDVTVDNSHFFMLSTTQNEHPFIQLSQERQNVTQAKLALVSHTIEGIEVFSELEKEPNETVFRIGVSVPFPIFNDKSEEKQLAKMELGSQQLLLDSQKKSQMIQLSTLQKEQKIWEVLISEYQLQISEKLELLIMYEKAYSFAKVNLIDLQKAKQGFLDIKEKIIKVTMALEKNIVKQNYLQGVYNE